MSSSLDIHAQPTAPSAPKPTNQRRATLGVGRGLRRRLFVHHLPLAVGSTGGLILLVRWSSHGPFSIAQLASPTGDIALVLLASTLVIGPANLVLRRRNPTNNYLRRDVGAWAAVWSIVHVVVAFQGHTSGTLGFVRYFFSDGKPLLDSVGLGNWTGLAATVIVVTLLVLSTDRYLRELKTKTWKDLQRLNYTLFALVVVHAIFYGALTRTMSPFTYAFIATTIAVLVGQAIGIWVYIRNHRGARSETLRATRDTESSAAGSPPRSRRAEG
jgi:sulfoxide reductase heme-binding subunit YedZ